MKTDPILPPVDESLDDSPRAALGSRGPLVAFTDFRKHDSSREPHELYDTLVTVPGQPNRQVDPHGDRQISTFFPAVVPVARGHALVAWQDSAPGPCDILIARVRPGAAGGRAHRVDDTGRAGWNQWRPALAVARGRVIAAWEDERDGPAQIYAARAPVARIR